LLGAAAAAATLPFAARLLAAPAAGGRFLLVFLRGGYDAANVLVPLDSAFYYEARPNIAIGRAEAERIAPGWGLHPALRDSVQAMYARGEAVFVPFAGSENLSRSHFETQDSIELGAGASRTGGYGSGFLNRVASRLAPGAAIAFTDQLPLILRGDAPVANVALQTLRPRGVDARQSRLIAGMYGADALGASVEKGFAARDELMREFADEMSAANRNAIEGSRFAAQARRIGRLMKGAYRLGFVDVGGWDTHVGEGGATGQLAQRLAELGTGLSALADELGPAWRDTCVAVISEFGRTFRENGNRGTDHGHGTVYWFLGGAVRGGRIVGAQLPVERATLFQDRDYPVLNEYRALLGPVLARLCGLAPADLERVFPGVAGVDLGIV
jgi:uncharacterized protein (DUF1501 family)